MDYFDRSGQLLFTVSCNERRDQYFLYDMAGEKPSRLGKGSSPAALEEKYNLAGRIGVK